MNPRTLYKIEKCRHFLTSLNQKIRCILLVLTIIVFIVVLAISITYLGNDILFFMSILLTGIMILFSELALFNSPGVPFIGENQLDDSRRISLTQFIPKTLAFFWILTGEFNSNFYDEEVVEKFRGLAEVRKVDFQVVYGPNFDIECVGILKLALMGKIKLYRLPDRDAVNFSHFRVIDGMHVCADFKKHVTFTGYSGGKFWFNNINLGREMMKRFEIAKSKSENITKKKLLKIINESTPILDDDIGRKPGFIIHDKNTGEARAANKQEIKNLREQLHGCLT